MKSKTFSYLEYKKKKLIVETTQLIKIDSELVPKIDIETRDKEPYKHVHIQMQVHPNIITFVIHSMQ